VADFRNINHSVAAAFLFAVPSIGHEKLNRTGHPSRSLSGSFKLGGGAYKSHQSLQHSRLWTIYRRPSDSTISVVVASSEEHGVEPPRWPLPEVMKNDLPFVVNTDLHVGPWTSARGSIRTKLGSGSGSEPHRYVWVAQILGHNQNHIKMLRHGQNHTRKNTYRCWC